MQSPKPKVICLQNAKALLFTTEGRTLIALLAGIGLCFMCYTAGYRISKSVKGGIAAAIGGIMYVYRAINRLREGGQLEIELYREQLKDKIYIITGGSRGIGWAACLLLSEGGAKKVVLAIRDSEKRAPGIRAEFQRFQTEYRIERPSLNMQTTELEFVEFDAKSSDSAKACAEKLRSMNSHYDGILCNAGVGLHFYSMEINWKNQAILLEHLGDCVDRVVTVSSVMHSIGVMSEKLDDIKKQSPLVRYGTSKLAMLFEARYLASRKIDAVSAHPGYVDTQMSRIFDFFGFPRCLSKCPRSGAMNLVACLIMRETQPGAYYDTLRVAPQLASAQSPDQYTAFLKLRQELVESQ